LEELLKNILLLGSIAKVKEYDQQKTQIQQESKRKPPGNFVSIGGKIILNNRNIIT
jgi:hypothetical protein